MDCSNGADEDKCTSQVNLFSDFNKYGNHRLDVPYLQRWLQTSPKACANHCFNAKDFQCKSFNYNSAKSLCILNELNIGLTGKLEASRDWDYYELKSKSENCQPNLKCSNGKCLQAQQICDGKYDCGGGDRKGTLLYYMKKIAYYILL